MGAQPSQQLALDDTTNASSSLIAPAAVLPNLDWDVAPQWALDNSHDMRWEFHCLGVQFHNSKILTQEM
jgi:hypothetical protein